MGFSVTASQVILLIAAFGAGSVLATALLGAAGDVQDGYRDAWRSREVAVHTNLTVVDDDSWPAYNPGPQRFTVRIENAGATELTVSGLTFLIDGAYADDLVTRYDVDGDTGTDLFLPGETLEVQFNPVASSPTHFKVTTEIGTDAYWRT